MDGEPAAGPSRVFTKGCFSCKAHIESFVQLSSPGAAGIEKLCVSCRKRKGGEDPRGAEGANPLGLGQFRAIGRVLVKSRGRVTRARICIALGRSCSTHGGNPVARNRVVESCLRGRGSAKQHQATIQALQSQLEGLEASLELFFKSFARVVKVKTRARELRPEL